MYRAGYCSFCRDTVELWLHRHLLRCRKCGQLWGRINTDGVVQRMQPPPIVMHTNTSAKYRIAEGRLVKIKARAA